LATKPHDSRTKSTESAALSHDILRPYVGMHILDIAVRVSFSFGLKSRVFVRESCGIVQVSCRFGGLSCRIGQERAESGNCDEKTLTLSQSCREQCPVRISERLGMARALDVAKSAQQYQLHGTMGGLNKSKHWR
jgi:hypothetical protein